MYHETLVPSTLGQCRYVVYGNIENLKLCSAISNIETKLSLRYLK